MQVLRLLLEILSFVVLRAAAQGCEDPELCKWLGIGLCATNPVVSKQCKKKCGICDTGIHCQKIVPVEHADIRTLSRPPYRVGTVANFTCHPGLKRIGPSTITCLSSGRWSDSTPYCTARRCGKDMGKVEEGRKCRKRCKKDSDCKGSKNKCRCDDWCGKSCFNPEENCPQLLKPNNGYIIANGWSYGRTVTYGCDEGYTLTGSSIRRCRSDRKWSGSTPLCLPYGACGQNSDTRISWSDGKVTNGNNAREGAWPWQVLLTDNNDYSVEQVYQSSSALAGGSVINEEWILSAAHVFTVVFSQNVKSSIWNNTFLIVTGMTKYPRRGLAIPEHIQIFTPRSVHIDPRFGRRSFDYDVALVRIGQRMKRGSNNVFVPDESNSKIIYSRLVRPVCLPCMKGDVHEPVDVLKNYDKLRCDAGRHLRSLYAPAGSSAMVTGFGKKEHGVAVSPLNLQQGVVKILDDLSCRDSVQDIKRHNNNAEYTGRMFCASGGNETAKVDSCKGDSGGPAVKMVLGNKKTYWMQVGIISWGAKCGGKHPGFYTSLPTVMPWVWKTLDGARNKIECGEKPLNRNRFNVSSCPSGKPVGAKCSVGCWEGYSLDTGEEVWTATCNLISSNSFEAEWSFTDMPTCLDCIEPSWCWLWQTSCDSNWYVKSNCKTSCGPCKRGTWDEWETWSACSVTCGGGEKFATRSCLGPGYCVGESRKTETCNLQACKGRWNDWSSWAKCSVTCGAGNSRRTRFCEGPGKCDGSSLETRTCKKGECPGKWSKWSPWAKCSVTCGAGNSRRTRFCEGPGKCDGNALETRTCKKCPCSGQWSNWSSWEECSVTCGAGNSKRTRFCQGPGKCDGNALETRTCKKEECPGKWSKWSPWEKCSMTCGSGNAKRTRSCLGPRICDGNIMEARICQMKDCPATWNDWTVWTECSKTCGGGIQYRSRTCSEAGKCTGSISGSRGCNLQQCDANNMKRDVLFLIQAGGSVGSRQFKKFLRLTQAILTYLCNGLIGLNGTRISVHTYDGVQRTHIWFNESLNKVELLKKIGSISHNPITGGVCCLNRSLEYAMDNLFTLSAGARLNDKDTKQHIFLLSDGCNYCRPKVDSVTELLDVTVKLSEREISIATFLVGTHSDERINELESLIDGTRCYQMFSFTSWDEVDLAIHGFETTDCISSWESTNFNNCNDPIVEDDV